MAYYCRLLTIANQSREVQHTIGVHQKSIFEPFSSHNIVHIFWKPQKVGKFSIEFAQIGLMLGTCIAFYIVISSLLVEVFADIIQSEPTLDSREELRRQFCLFLGFFIVLPLGLLRNMSSIGKFWSNVAQKRLPLQRYQNTLVSQ